VRVNSDPIHDGTDQFFQWLAVDPQTGAANVIFYDRREDPQNVKTTITLARSSDGGKSFTNYAWSQEPFASHRQFIGDYVGIAAWEGRVYGIWTEVAPVAPSTPAKEKPAAAAGEQQHRTVIKIGMAEFGGATSAATNGDLAPLRH